MSSDGTTLLSLPPDVLFDILRNCDIQSLGRLSRCCRRLNDIVRLDCVWINRSKNVIVANQKSETIRSRSCCQLAARDKCRIATNWIRRRYEEEVALVQRTRYMPWLQITDTHLWYSKGNTILCFRRYDNGKIGKSPLYSLRGHIDDVCRFVCKDGLVVSGGRDGTVCGWNKTTGTFLFCRRKCHNSDVGSVDVWKNTFVSGSKDKNVKVWTLQNNMAVCQYSVQIRDRIWAVAVSPSGRAIFSGSAGYNNIPPLQMMDLETGTKICHLGSSHRNGGGVLHVHPESPWELLSCGYDTCVKMWDTRTGANCVRQWEDPHDSAVYCVASDHNVTFLSGTARHGLVRLWDKRTAKPFQMFYVGRGNSPVYSLTFDPCHMYVALDRSLNLLRFSNYYGSTFH